MEFAKTPLFNDTQGGPSAFQSPPTVGEIAAFLSARLARSHETAAEADDVPLVWPSHAAKWDATVRRMVLALEWEGRLKSAARGPDTALFLHRPFDLPPGELPNLLAVFASHAGFDAHLTTAYNPALARALDITNVEPVRDSLKNDATVGMIGNLPAAPTGAEFLSHVQTLFGGVDAAEVTDAQRETMVRRVVVMSALRPNLVAQVAGAGATAYVTGQLREAARAVLRERGMGVIAVGHRRSEMWGLHQLGRELGAAFPSLDVAIHDNKR